MTGLRDRLHGCLLGAQAIDADLLAGLEGHEVIGQIADDLYEVFASDARAYRREEVQETRGGQDG